MPSILNSSNLVFATAMVASSTLMILAYFRHNKGDSAATRQADVRILRPCLCSGGNKDRKKKQKKVQFAENVKKKATEAEEMKRKITARKLKKNRCRSSFQGSQMPENRVALYNGILRDRSNRMGFSY
ncbi:uncharacterized protein LOC111497701 [Cucurbita maxima]|uniref:Uncharacterized protein LOC111497701 n=1 Tax=Cucurbita maxima TaxID=3661 RepID=A0A6J1KUC7_CUCMA|nr:uncharacterized protein LOC111497701 [Cucurbita maxima]